MANFHKAIVFYNESSGQSNEKSQISAIETHFKNRSIEFQLHRVPMNAIEIKNIIAKGRQNSIDLIVAAGGDGTVSMVGSPLIDCDIPLGILPTGTGNLLAKDLNIPMQFDKALEVITSPNSKIFAIDTFCLNHQNYVMNLSIGISSKIMAETGTEEKQKLGFFAYLKHFIRILFRIEMSRFLIEYDDLSVSRTASEVIVANSRLLAAEIFEWPNDVTLNDGKLDIFVIRAANLRDVIHFVASVFSKYRIKIPIVDYHQFEKYCLIETKEPKKVQADGDTIGETPVRLDVKPQSLKLIVPSLSTIRSTK